MAAWQLSASGAAGSSQIYVAIETPHGPVVETLIERGFMVHAINPKQMDRFRDRFTLAGAKDDSRDAEVMASALRTDPNCLAGVAPVNKRSGKSCIVVRRQACSNRLANAMYHWARIAIQHDPTSKAKYAALRGRGARSWTGFAICWGVQFARLPLWRGKTQGRSPSSAITAFDEHGGQLSAVAQKQLPLKNFAPVHRNHGFDTFLGPNLYAQSS